jgi:hypothetical protein
MDILLPFCCPFVAGQAEIKTYFAAAVATILIGNDDIFRVPAKWSP